jgi:hypothetical protein
MQATLDKTASLLGVLVRVLLPTGVQCTWISPLQTMYAITIEDKPLLLSTQVNYLGACTFGGRKHSAKCMIRLKFWERSPLPSS